MERASNSGLGGSGLMVGILVIFAGIDTFIPGLLTESVYFCDEIRILKNKTKPQKDAWLWVWSCTCCPIPQEAEAGDPKFQAGLSYYMRPLLSMKKEKKKKKRRSLKGKTQNVSNPCEFLFSSVVVHHFFIYPIVVDQLSEAQLLILILRHNLLQLIEQLLAALPPLLY